MQQLEALKGAVAVATTVVNARGNSDIQRLHDIPVRVPEVALHGVRYGATDALAAVQS